jgi:hypothetical protein
MAKRTLALSILALVAVAAFVTWGYRTIPTTVPAREDVWIPKNAIVLDSAQIQGSQKAFVFQYDLGAFGYSVTMVSLREPSHLPGFLLLTGSPTHVWWNTPDTLMVEVRSGSNEFSAPPKGVVVIPTRARKPTP